MSVGQKKDALTARVDEMQAKLDDAVSLLGLRRQSAKIESEHSTLAGHYSQFPVFGTKIKDAQAELAGMKRLVADWQSYEDESKALDDWKATDAVIEAEAVGMGYPDLLEEDWSGDIAGAGIRVKFLDDDIRRFDRLDVLTETVSGYPDVTGLEVDAKDAGDDLDVLSARNGSLSEFKGALGGQLDSLVDLKARKAEIEDRLSDQKKVEKECRLLDLIARFYAPRGFKVYELKRRSSALIDRANYWSSLFFQEPYEWSLSDDVDNLDFLVQPVNDRKTEPYPVALLSSGEYNRASHVLVFSQIELIPPSKNLNTLFLDEIEGNLDEAGMLAFIDEVLPKLKEVFSDKTVILISHLNSILNSGVIDHMWVSERKDRKSNLKTFPWYQRRRQQQA